MISDRIELRGFDEERLANLVGLAGTPGRGSSAAWAPGLVVVRSGHSVVKALHTTRGRLDPAAVSLDLDLPALASGHAARWVVVAEVAALGDAFEATAGRLMPGCDLVELMLELVRSLGAEVEAGRVAMWPALTEGVTVPDRSSVERAFDLVLPPQRSALLYVFDSDALHAEVICVRGLRDVELLAGHDALGVGPPPRDWRGRHKEVLDAIARNMEPPAVGAFLSLDAVRSLRDGLAPAGLSALVRSRELIIDPLPLWLSAPLGLAAARGALEAGRRTGSRLARAMDPHGRGARLADRLASAVKARVRSSEVAGQIEGAITQIGAGADLTSLLGFDPFALAGRLSALLRES
jgi:hypothetical protein